MKLHEFETTETPEVIIDSSDDLRVMGDDLPAVVVEGPQADELQAEAAAQRVSLTLSRRATVRVPRQARLSLAKVAGDARVEGLDSAVTIGQVRGDLVLRQTAGAEIEHVGGDVSAKKIGGALSIGFAGGDVSARGVAGPFTAERTAGDVYLRKAAAGARVKAGGDIALHLDFQADQAYEFVAGGDLTSRVSPEASATLALHAGGDISVSVPDANVEGDDHEQTVILGGGEAQVRLRAGGDITLSDVTADSSGVAESGDDFGSHIAAQIEGQMAELQKHLNQELSHLDFHIDAEAVAANARHAAERQIDAARRKAERLAETARRKEESVRRRADAARRRAERIEERARRRTAFLDFGKNLSVNFDRPARPPRPPAPPPAPDAVSDEERMSILRMLEQGKISVAEAEKLLSALEGK